MTAHTSSAITGSAISQLLRLPRKDAFISPPSRFPLPASRFALPASSSHDRKLPLQRRYRHVVTLMGVDNLGLDIDCDTVGELDPINLDSAGKSAIHDFPAPRKDAAALRHLDRVGSHYHERIIQLRRRILRACHRQFAFHAPYGHFSGAALIDRRNHGTTSD